MNINILARAYFLIENNIISIIKYKGNVDSDTNQIKLQLDYSRGNTSLLNP